MRLTAIAAGCVVLLLTVLTACAILPRSDIADWEDPSDPYRRVYAVETISARVIEADNVLKVEVRGTARGGGWTQVGLRLIGPAHGGRGEIVAELVGLPPAGGVSSAAALAPVEAVLVLVPPPTPRQVRVISASNELSASYQ